jgi:hypothetical protein
MQVEAEFLIVAVGERALTSRRNGCIADQLAQLVVLVAELVVGQKKKTVTLPALKRRKF